MHSPNQPAIALATPAPQPSSVASSLHDATIASTWRRHRIQGPAAPLSIIGRGMEIVGDLRIPEGTDLIVLGTIRGSIESEGRVVIEASAVVHGAVRAREVCVSGILDSGAGGILARGRLFIGSGGRVSADDISYGAIEIESGARLCGDLRHHERTGALEQQHPLAQRVAAHGLTAAPVAQAA